MSLAFHRKYRPQRLDHIRGQEITVQILKNAARANKLAQGYLFYGPRGTGKTTTARLVAKLANCKRRYDDPEFQTHGEPCGECVSCVAITNGTSLDLIEIDAASNRGIDEIRNLKESIRVSPAQNPFKIYIIDEAHMLTRDAFNALLKTLEEPPQHAILILATTEYEKLPPTITSRTQRFLFKKLSKTEILQELEKVSHAEHIEIEHAALELISAAAEGSLRDALSLLDQITTLKPHASENTHITLESVEHITGRIGLKKIEMFAHHILEEDLSKTLILLSEIYDEGHNIVQFTKDLIHYFRKLISLNLNPSLEKFFHAELTDDEYATLHELSKKIRSKEHIMLVRSLIRAYGEMRYSPFTLIPLELTLVEHLKK